MSHIYKVCTRQSCAVNQSLMSQIRHTESCDVISHPCHQRACAEAIHLRERKIHDPAKAVLSNLISNILAGYVYEHIIEGAAEPSH